LHPRTSVIENINRMINCGDPAFGGVMYGCADCGTLKFAAFRCHSRFCTTCGTKYSIDRTTSMSFKIINVQHRHCVFTIDSELRHFFLKDRSLLGLLFSAVQSVILHMFHKENKTESFTPGFICVLHTSPNMLLLSYMEEITMSKHLHEIRNKYIENPPEGMTADDIRRMSEDDLLDMDYFLNEDDIFDEVFPGAEGFYIF